MQRAALERARTRNVWKAHVRAHTGPLVCACDLQPGRFRKGQRVGGCGRTRCWLCHGDKLAKIVPVRVRRALPRFAEGIAEITDCGRPCTAPDHA